MHLLFVFLTHIVFAYKWGPGQTGNQNVHFHTVRWLPCTLDLAAVVTPNFLGVFMYYCGTPLPALMGRGMERFNRQSQANPFFANAALLKSWFVSKKNVSKFPF